MKNIPGDGPSSERKSMDFAIKLLLVIVLVAWCIRIILPFIVPVFWGAILAIVLFPFYARVLRLFRGRIALTSAFMVAILLLLLICPSVWIISSMAQNSSQFITSLRDHTLVIPSPRPEIAGWPVIGKPLYSFWNLAATNTAAAIAEYREPIIMVGEKLLGAAKNIVSGFLTMLLSIVISGVLLGSAERTQKTARDMALRLFGSRGEMFVPMIVLTIRNVAKGILGVAFIQFALLGTCFILAEVPFPGLCALAVLLLAIIQLPVGLVAIPVVIYFYSARDPVSATLWSILVLLFAVSDNILKPWLMGKGAPVPMLVIFLGAIGGMIMSGFIGLFTGAIVLSIGYRMTAIWLTEDEKDALAPSSA